MDNGKLDHSSMRLRTALLKGALKELLDDGAIWDAINEKLPLALINWAVVKMGPNGQKYIVAAVKQFLLMAVPLMVTKGWDTAKVAKGIPFMIPTRLSKTDYSLFDRVFTLDLFGIGDEYHALLQELKDIKKKKWRNQANYKMTLKEKLPGVKDKMISTYSGMKASDIAADYVAWKCKMKREALKKWLALTDLKKLMKSINAQIARNTRLPQKLVNPKFPAL